MSTVPRFGLLDLTVAMAPTLISAVLSWIGAYQSRTKPVRAGYPAAFIAILLIWLATFALLCVTYIDMNAPYRY